jgi:hypothetical protein
MPEEKDNPPPDWYIASFAKIITFSIAIESPYKIK